AFDKALVAPPGQPPAAFICPGHPLLDAVVDVTLERHRDLLRRGTVLVDERDPGTSPRLLFFLEHAIQDASLTRTGERRVVSKRLLFVEIGADGTPRHANHAPYLDYRPLAEGEPTAAAILDRPECAWIGRDLEARALAHAITEVVPQHLAEIRAARCRLLDKTEAAVKDRLTKEISYWDLRAEELCEQER
ncbi:MAG: RNA helicase, partial [Oscillochloridaceae bacterium]|nr:RNA helicase [Oscillochloridaceae bacterium]